ncbi:hypothetical protein ACWGID_39140 [Kribbella sp. NPDC054772]
MRFTRIRKRGAAVVMAMVAAAFVVPLAAQVQAPAQAQAAPSGTVGTTAWTPQIYPLFSGEWVQRNVSSADRNTALALCAAARGIACVSVGQGDGRHSVFHLFKCDTRSLSNFINALAVLNHQTNNKQVHFWGPHKYVYIPANNRITLVADSGTIDFNRLDIC